MLTEEEIIEAYRYFLGRRPENPQVVADLQRRLTSFDDLRAEFFASAEFRSQIDGKGEAPRRYFSKPLDWPPIEVEHEISGPSVALMLEHIQKNWQLLGISEPHWSVLSDESFRASRIHDNEDHFYESGRDALRLLDSALTRNGLQLGQFARCFELGCGLGRLTIWLARRFERVTAMDISPSHLRLAERYAAAQGIDNIDFHRLGSIDDLPTTGSFDLFLSIIVLQHNPPPVIVALLESVLSRLAEGGVAYFQLSTYHRHYRFALDEYLTALRPDGSIEMHVLPQAALFALVRRCGCDVLEIREDEWTGQQDSISNTLLVRKPFGAGSTESRHEPALSRPSALSSPSGESEPDLAQIRRNILGAGRLKAISSELERGGNREGIAAEIGGLLAQDDLPASLRQTAGLILSSIDEYELALSALRAAAREAPGLPGISPQLAAALEATGRPVEALQALRQGILAEPLAVRDYRRLPVLEFLHGDPSHAVDHLSKLLRHEPKVSEAAAECGCALISAGRPDLAKLALECGFEVVRHETPSVAEYGRPPTTPGASGGSDAPRAPAPEKKNDIFACVSMPKTSSTSLASALRKSGHHDAYHTHVLGRGTLILKRRLQGAGPTTGQEPELVRRLDESGSVFNIVTCIRDPIARTLAHFAQYALRQKVQFGIHVPLNGESAIGWFAEQFSQERSTWWFDDTFKSTFGFDFRAHPFDFERRSIRFDSERLRLLVLRLEDPGPAKEAELAWLTRRDVTDLPTLNLASTKDTAASYDALASSFVAPSAWLDSFYETELARHFYRSAEIEAFRSRWSGERRGHG